MTEPTPDQILQELRVDIDRIDAAMHALLIERGGIIERLIRVKAGQGGGSAFRPGREAEMMWRLARRHEGPLPLDTVESIWRIIISTFTFVQAPYAVHVDTGRREAAMRDSARFHFGFTVPLHPCADPAEVIEAVAAADNDLGLLPLAGDGSEPWWPLLVGPGRPRVIARLPFVERDDHPAGLPVLVIAKAGAAAAVRDRILFVLEGQPTAPLPDLDAGMELVAQATGHALVAVAGPDADGPARWAGTHPGWTATEIGSHAARPSLATA